MDDESGGTGWLLAHAADALRADDRPSAADALAASRLELERGSSWSDGHDGYIYDVGLTLVVPPDAAAEVNDAVDALRSIFARLVAVFPDESGDLVKATLEQFVVVTDESDPAEQRHTGGRPRATGCPARSGALRCSPRLP